MATLRPLDTTNLLAKFAWERPERKDQAGNLVIFGGVSLKLKEVDTIFKFARSYGFGSVYALVPESLAKVFKQDDPYLIPVNFDGYYGLTDTGAKTFQDEFGLADALILADIGNSSATQHKLALQLSQTLKPVIVTDSAIGLILSYHAELLNNSRLILLINLQNLQRVIKALGSPLKTPILSSSSFKIKLQALGELQQLINSQVVLLDESRMLSADAETYIATALNKDSLNLAARLAAWQVWSKSANTLEKIFAAQADL